MRATVEIQSEIGLCLHSELLLLCARIGFNP
jgi:hypothetical protein